MSYIKPLIASLVVTPMLSLTSCGGDSNAVRSGKKVLGELMENKPMREYEKIMAGFEGYDSYMKESKVQSAVDSVAYKDVFNKTPLAKDTNAKAEFKAIAKQTRPDLSPGTSSGFDEVSSALDEKIKDLNISKKAYEANEKEYSSMKTTRQSWPGTSTSIDYDKIIATKQFKADSVAYRKFFKKHDLLKDFAEELTKVAKKVKP
ncbi:hypothetical protein IJ674_00645 [bacterium]|nr:hypothetical protein [bacterium]